MSAFRAILAKDLRTELRTLESVPAMALFAPPPSSSFASASTAPASRAASPRACCWRRPVRRDPRDQPRLRRRARAGRLRRDPPGAGRRRRAVRGQGLRARRLPGRARADRGAGVRDLLPRRRRAACWRCRRCCSLADLGLATIGAHRLLDRGQLARPRPDRPAAAAAAAGPGDDRRRGRGGAAAGRRAAPHTTTSASGSRCSLSTISCSRSSATRSTTSCSRTSRRAAET